MQTSGAMRRGKESHVETEIGPPRVAGPPFFCPPPHFPSASKRIMMAVRFAFGEIYYMFNIKGLARGWRLWRVV